MGSADARSSAGTGPARLNQRSMRDTAAPLIGLAGITLLLGAVSPCAGQLARPLTLKPPSAALPAEFSIISTVREIADGRVLVVDSREQRVVVADFRDGTAKDVGRAGGGPGEYRFPRLLVALTGDSTLLPTTGLRWLLLVGADFVATLAADRPEVAAVRGDMLAADSTGGVFTRVPGPASCTETATKQMDTTYVVRTSRRDMRRDTVARLGVAPTIRRRATFADGTRAERCTPPVLPPNDDAAPFSDGWVAIARQSPYRVDWRQPRVGTLVPGKPLPVELPRFTEKDRRAIIDSFPRRPNRMPDFDFDHIPERAPAFQAGALTAMPDGRLLVRRTLLASDAASRYDIVDRSAMLAGTLSLPRNSRIAGFGKASVYVVSTDTDGIQRLQRHPWP